MNKKSFFNLIIVLILFLLSLFIYLFVFNDDFLYKKDILKITSINTIKEERYQNDLGLTEKHYTKEINGFITNGNNKNKKMTIEYEETYSSVVTDKYKVGDKVILKRGEIEDLKRDHYICLMFLIFINLIYIVGSYKGLLSVVSVILNMIIFYLGLNLYFKGINLLFICLIEAILFSVISLFIAGGINKKTISAIVSVLSTTIFIIILVNFTRFFGINYNELMFLTVPPEEVLLAELLIGSMGAVMDVCITISSSIEELINKDKNISVKNLTKSSKQIGKDIMSTMTNVLFFTYLCGVLPIFVLATRNGFTVVNYMKSNFSLELTRFLIGAIAIVISIPISSFISIKIFKRGEINE